MAGSPTKRERREKWQRYIRTENSFDEFMDFIMDGGTISEFAIEKDSKYLWVIEWVERNEKLHEQYLKAKERQADIAIDSITKIADKCSTETAQHVSKAKLQVDARIKFASKISPEKYGDKINHSSDGSFAPYYSIIAVPPKDKKCE